MFFKFDDGVFSIFQQQSMVLLDMKTSGVNILRPLSVFGSKDSPHGHAEVEFKDVRVPASNMLLGKELF